MVVAAVGGRVGETVTPTPPRLLVSSRLVSFHLTSSHFVSSHLTSPRLTSSPHTPHFTSSNLTSPHLACVASSRVTQSAWAMGARSGGEEEEEEDSE
ncbi:hypothetical protein M0802_008331 [Mischocyttarus mexicanus]|nr:hypothetical protein M0802_008331 [Mischocyttarus mexicanus]